MRNVPLDKLLLIPKSTEPDLVSVIQHIVEHPHREITVDTPLVELEELSEPETEALLELVMNPGTISPAKRDTPVHFDYEGREFQFTHVYDVRRRIMFDTHPNRFLRHFLIRFCDALKRAGAGKKDDGKALLTTLSGFVAGSFLKDVTALASVTTDHNVLRKDPNYQQILKASVALSRLTTGEATRA